MRKIILVLVVIVLGLSSTSAQERPSIQSLKGLKGVKVVLERPTTIEAHGVNSFELTSIAELKLRVAGIKILSDKEFGESPGAPLLILDVKELKSETGSVVITIRVRFKQAVKLVREPSMFLLADTWEVNNVLLLGKSRLREVRETIGEGVDLFINDFLSVNPK